MKKTARLFGAYLPILLILLPAAVVLRTVACFNDMTSNGYFDKKIIITAANVVITAAVILAFTYLAVAKKNAQLVYRPESPLNFIPCALICAALFFVAIYALISAIPSIKDYLAIPPEFRAPKALLTPVISLITAFTAVISIPYFMFSAIWAKAKSILIANLGLAPLVFLCFMIANIYFDNGAPLNMPGKIVSLMAYISAAVFFLYEIRLPLGREKWRAYVCFGMICTLLCAYSAIPSIILCIAKPNSLNLLAINESEIILTLAMFIFAAFKLILSATLIEDKDSTVTQKVREFALARSATLERRPEEEEPEEEITDSEENEITENEQIENQESFFGEAYDSNDTEAQQEDLEVDNDTLSELEEISEARRLELSANIDTPTDESKKEADNQ